MDFFSTGHKALTQNFSFFLDIFIHVCEQCDSNKCCFISQPIVENNNKTKMKKIWFDICVFFSSFFVLLLKTFAFLFFQLFLHFVMSRIFFFFKYFLGYFQDQYTNSNFVCSSWFLRKTVLMKIQRKMYSIFSH